MLYNKSKAADVKHRFPYYYADGSGDFAPAGSCTTVAGRFHFDKCILLKCTPPNGPLGYHYCMSACMCCACISDGN